MAEPRILHPVTFFDRDGSNDPRMEGVKDFRPRPTAPGVQDASVTSPEVYEDEEEESPAALTVSPDMPNALPKS